jgi:hypothetical protein
METLSFALGAASVGVLLIVVSLIWVLLRVKEIVKEQNNTIERLLNLERILSQRMDNSENHYSDEIKEVYNTIHSRVDEVYRNLEPKIEQSHRHIDDLHSESMSYTDSRIDKLINNPKFCLNKDKELLTD